MNMGGRIKNAQKKQTHKYAIIDKKQKEVFVIKAKILFTLFILFLLFGCSEKSDSITADIVPEASEWKLDSSISYAQKFIMNMFLVDSTAYLMTPDIIRPYGESTNDSWFHHLSADLWAHPYYSVGLSKDYYVVNYNDSSIHFKKTASPVGTSIYIDIQDIDSSLVSIGHLGITSLGDNKFVTTAEFKDSTGLLLMSVKNEEMFYYAMNTYPLIGLLDVMELPLDSLVEFTPVKVAGYKNNYFSNVNKGINNIITTISHRSYLVTPEGVSYPLDNMNLGDFVVYDDSLLFSTAEVYSSRAGSSSIVVSSDDGLTWSAIGNELFSFHSKQKCLDIVNGEIIAYRDDQIYHYSKMEDKFSIKALENSGIEGNQITRIAYLNDKVIMSTLSGLFYKEWDDFIGN